MAKKTLLAVFSRTGITKALARAVAVKTGYDMFVINSAHTYPKNFFMCCLEAKKEKDKNMRPLIMGKPQNIGSYDRVVIFFPVWAFSCPRIILTFLEENDFAGKTIIPVCTYMKTGKGKSEEEMKVSCPNAVFEPCIEATALKDQAVSIIADKLKDTRR